MIFALVGNQNCGKTTLFNALTGSNQHVGNFPGVTVDQKIGDIRGEKDCSVVDLPGIYSLRPYTQEEIVSRDFIINQKPDGIINIVDATNIERNLYLTLQLLELRVPMVLALNMMDEGHKIFSVLWMLQTHFDERSKIVTQTVLIDQSGVSLNDPLLFHMVDTLNNGRNRQMYFLTDIGSFFTGIFLQDFKNFVVDRIHMRYLLFLIFVKRIFCIQYTLYNVFIKKKIAILQNFLI